MVAALSRLESRVVGKAREQNGQHGHRGDRGMEGRRMSNLSIFSLELQIGIKGVQWLAGLRPKRDPSLRRAVSLWWLVYFLGASTLAWLLGHCTFLRYP